MSAPVRVTLFTFLWLFCVMAGQSLAAVTEYTDRTAFEAVLHTKIIDDYSDLGYTTGDVQDNATFDIFTDAAMTAVLGETAYTSTRFTDINIVQDSFGNRVYCAGCNGTFQLDFRSTSVGDDSGVFGVGFFITFNETFSIGGLDSFVAFVTYGDDTTENFSLPPGNFNFWGLTANKKITSIHIGGPDGTTPPLSISDGFRMDDLTIGSGQPVAGPLSLAVNSTVEALDGDPGDGLCETAAGNGVCTLRAAIMETNAWPGKDTVTVPGGLYSTFLASPPGDAPCDSFIFGGISITDDLVLVGSGPGATVLTTSELFASPLIICDGTVEISGINFQQSFYGLQVLPDATVTLSQSWVKRNTIGILNIGTLTLRESAVFENSNSTGFAGAGIVNQLLDLDDQFPILMVEYSSIYANESLGDGAGIYNEDGIVEIRNSTVSNNRSECRGGGIFSEDTFFGPASLTIANSVIDGNSTTDEFFNFSCGDEPARRDGGGIHTANDLHIKNSRICQNQSTGRGGGLLIHAEASGINNNTIVTIEDSTICENTAGNGGGGLYIFGARSNPIIEIGQDIFRITGSTIRDNVTNDETPGLDLKLNYGGGGLYLLARANEHPVPDGEVAPVTLVRNSTFSGNRSAQADGGAIRISNRDCCNSPFPLTVENSTVTKNAAVFSGGGGIDGVAALTNVIVADNIPGGDCINDNNGFGAISWGHNLDSDDSCNLSVLLSDLPNTDPLLGPLFRNGSLTGVLSQTRTHALLFPSPAIDGGEDIVAPLFDQRGLSRIGQSDIGAYEWFATVDGDQDGILNNVDLAPVSFSNNFSDVTNGGSSHGTITGRGFFGQTKFSVEDAAEPNGLVVSASGTGTGSLSLCGSPFSAFMTSGDTWVVTCGSLGAWVLGGEIEIALNDTVNLILPQYARVTIDEDDDGNPVVQNQINSPVTVTLEVDGFKVPVPTGSAVTLGGCTGDANVDGAMTPKDIAAVTRAIPSTPADPRWNPDADINDDGRVDGMDLALARGSFLDPSCLRGPGTAPLNGLPSASQH